MARPQRLSHLHQLGMLESAMAETYSIQHCDLHPPTSSWTNKNAMTVHRKCGGSPEEDLFLGHSPLTSTHIVQSRGACLFYAVAL